MRPPWAFLPWRGPFGGPWRELAAASLFALALAPAGGAALSFEGEATRIERALDEGDVAERVEATRSIVALRVEEARPLVARALADPELDVRLAALEASSRLGLSELLDVTRRWLDDDDPVVRVAAIRAEGALGDATSLPRLVRAFADTRFAVRREAANAVGQIAADRLAGEPLAGDAATDGQPMIEDSVGPLAALLDDPDASVRVASARALGAFSREGLAFEGATRALVARSLDPELELRREVIRSLGRLSEARPDDVRFEATLMSALDDAALPVRLEAIAALGRSRSVRAVPALRRIALAGLDAEARASAVSQRELASESPTLIASLGALSRVDAPEARDALVAVLAEAGPSLALERALEAVAATRGAELDRAFADALLAERDDERRTRLVEGLSAFPHEEGSGALVQALLVAAAEGSIDDGALLPALGMALPRRSDTPHDAAPPSSMEVAASEALVRLLTALVEPATVGLALDGLERAARRGALDPSALDVLASPDVMRSAAGRDVAPGGAAAGSEVEDRRPELARLIGLLDDPRATRALVRMASASSSEPRALRASALDALSRLDALDASSLRALAGDVVADLGSREPRERSTALRFLLRHVDASLLALLLDAEAEASSIDRAGLLELIVISRFARPEATPALRERAEERVVRALSSSDPRESSAAAAALVGRLSASSGDDARRASVLALLEAAARRVAEAPSRGDRRALARLARASRCGSAPCLALTEGDPEEAFTLAPGASEGALSEWRFPHAISRSYALLSAARSGALDATSAPLLCALARRREPSVRANAGLALAALGRSCEDVDPAAWFTSSPNAGVRLAGLSWCVALDAGDPEARCDRRRLERAAQRCVEIEADPPLRAACEGFVAGAPVPSRFERGALLDLVVVDEDARPLPDRLVSVRFRDGSMIALTSDAAGRIALLVDREQDASFAPLVEDPYAMVLER